MKTMVESCRAEGSEAGLLEDLKRMWGGWEDLKRISQAEFSYYENLKTILERLKGLTDKFTEVMGGLEEHMLSLRSPHEALKMCMRELRVSVGSVKYYSILRRHRGEVEIQNDYLECFKEYIKEFLKWHKKYEYVDLVSYKLSILSLKISINSKCSKLDV
ncbi:hypothetical protein SUGI_0732090 [Cryptomeria japonica]|nr:hypothetical protein SUGI_0732090 [Cryptomeria japonica]